MKQRPSLTTARAAQVFNDALACRRDFFQDDQFFKMPDVLEIMFSEFHGWKLKTYRTKENEDFKRKAGVVVFEDRVMLTVDERLYANAKRGCSLSNYILAHEVGHLILEHHAKSAVTKNFQLFSGPNGMSNIPPTVEELEANFAGTFFQCGVALADKRWNTAQLAQRASSDYRYVQRAQTYAQLGVFEDEVARQRNRFPRVVL